jgi:hypothetical protein
MKLDGFNTGAFSPEHIATLGLAEKALRLADPADATAAAIKAVLLHVCFVDSEVAAYRGERDGFNMGARSPSNDFPEAPCDVASHREAALRYPHETQRRPRESYAGGFERGYIRGAARALECAVDDCEPGDAAIFARRIDTSDGQPETAELVEKWVAAGDGEDADGLQESLFHHARDLWTARDED